MIPYLDDKYEMLRMLSDAIKGVYASVYFRDSKAYMQATSNVIDQEKMAVILQEVVGNQYGDRYYPSMSGVARSLNYYPIGDEKAGQIHRGRRYDSPVLSLSPQPSSANQRNGDCAQRNPNTFLCTRPA